MTQAGTFDLERFVAAQEPLFGTALAELKAGQKRSHWMWFVFPQMRGLGLSPMAEHYGIGSLAEAEAYLAHPLLGPRLELCASTVLALQGASLYTVFDSPDDKKFCSSMTLFALAQDDDGKSVFHQALARYCGGCMDQRTIALLQKSAGD